MDEKQRSNVRSFPARVVVDAVVSPPEPEPARPQKLGLYPLGADDVIVSKGLYDLILVTLEGGTAADRATVATMMRTAYGAPFS